MQGLSAILALLILVPGTASAVSQKSSQTRCPTWKVETLATANRSITRAWTFEAREALVEGPMIEGEALLALQAEVRSRTGLDSRGLLQNQFAFMEKIIASYTARPPEQRPSNLPGLLEGQEHTRKILSGEIGRFRELGCLEIAAFGELLKIVDLRKAAAEFLVEVYVKDGVAIAIGTFDARNEYGGSPSDAHERKTAALEKSGWILDIHLHSHPFMLHFYPQLRPSDELTQFQLGGNVHPSDADLSTWKKKSPRRAWITNGLQTLEF